MRVLIVPDKFKGTLSAGQVARAIQDGWRRERPDDVITCLPMSDGGDGFGEVLGGLTGAAEQTVPTTDAAGRGRPAKVWWEPRRRLVILEAAQSNGLALLPPKRFHPFDLDTTGVAKLVDFARRQDARHCLIGVGGSATNEGGFGLARALGWRFYDRAGHPLERWTDLARLSRVAPPATSNLAECRFVVATDVDNPLLGVRGATRVYGPQKGLSPADQVLAETGLRALARVMRRTTGFDSRQPGCGAAGGLGYGLQAFLGAHRRLGFDVFAEYAELDRHLRGADLVITGEGAFDRQSVMGKGVGQLIRRAREHDVPVLVLAGRVDRPARRPSAIYAARALCDLVSLEEALQRPLPCLRRLASEMAKSWSGRQFSRRAGPVRTPRSRGA